MRAWLERAERFWCKKMHGEPMWPSRGRYQCRVCLREFSVLFERTRREPAFLVARGELRPIEPHGY